MLNLCGWSYRVVHWGRNHCDNRYLDWCRANSLTVSGFHLSDSVTILCAFEDSRSFMGGSDVVHCVWVSLTGATVAPFWAHWSVVWIGLNILNSLCKLFVEMGAL